MASPPALNSRCTRQHIVSLSIPSIQSSNRTAFLPASHPRLSLEHLQFEYHSSMEDVATPSVNAELMAGFIGRRVRLVCELDNLGDGQTLQAKAADKNIVVVQKARRICHAFDQDTFLIAHARLSETHPLSLSQDARAGMPTTRFVEFVGTVVDANTLKEESNSSWGDNFGARERETILTPMRRGFA